MTSYPDYFEKKRKTYTWSSPC